MTPISLKPLFLKDKSKINVDLYICSKSISIAETVKLQGIKIAKDVIFDTHIAKMCSKTAAQPNAVRRLNRYLSKSAGA